MEMLSGAEMVVRSLIDQGVKQVFGYPGGAVLDIYDALHTVGGIDHVLVRHEQAAVHMADGLARATGEVGVVLVTSGPGATTCRQPESLFQHLRNVFRLLNQKTVFNHRSRNPHHVALLKGIVTYQRGRYLPGKDN